MSKEKKNEKKLLKKCKCTDSVISKNMNFNHLLFNSL